MSVDLREKLSYEKQSIEKMSIRRDSFVRLQNNVQNSEDFTTEEKKSLSDRIHDLDREITKKTEQLNTKTIIYDTKIKVLLESLHRRETLINKSIESIPNCDDIMQIFAKQQSALTNQLNKYLQQIEE